MVVLVGINPHGKGLWVVVALQLPAPAFLMLLPPNDDLDTNVIMIATAVDICTHLSYTYIILGLNICI